METPPRFIFFVLLPSNLAGSLPALAPPPSLFGKRTDYLSIFLNENTDLLKVGRMKACAAVEVKLLVFPLQQNLPGSFVSLVAAFGK